MKVIKNQEKIIRYLSYIIPFSNMRKRFRRKYEQFSFKEESYFKNSKYNLVSLGSNCFPRVIATASKLKAPKKYGELSCPFDLSMHHKIEVITDLIKNNFDGFFENIEFDNEKKCWVNPKLSSVYNHERVNNINYFTKRYKDRIRNFYSILNDDKPLFFLYLANENDTEQKLLELYEVLKEKRAQKPFYLTVIDYNGLEIKDDRIFLIKINKDLMIQNKEWPDFCKKIKKSEESKKLYFSVVQPLRKYIKSSF